MDYLSYGVTHVGRVRKLNEDAILERADKGLWLVADGVGGLNCGDYASQLIVSRLAKIPQAKEINQYVEALQDELWEINRELRAEALDRGVEAIASTAVILVVVDSHYACLWVGDSRGYLLRAQQLHALTRDHSQVEQLVAQGVISRSQAENHPLANVITRAVGGVDNLLVDVQFGQLAPDDLFLLCSDGLYNETPIHEVANRLSENNDLQQTGDALLETTLARGARDNVSIVLVSVR